jgi:hypothetical protein
LSLLPFGDFSFGDYWYHHYEKRDILKQIPSPFYFFVISWNNKVWQGSRALQSGFLPGPDKIHFLSRYTTPAAVSGTVHAKTSLPRP